MSDYTYMARDIARQLLELRGRVNRHRFEMRAVIGGSATGLDQQIDGALDEATKAIDQAVVALQQT
ncbi:hypothetical protein D2E25_0601 [Bifidobacterium goeldii]|uniref:Uncharacterized protein n=1 Tax=Bifidobacterium goeldii TaxID=2306975 RepID=A0A430FN79_9BIFI|nr:hypothetical protein [Bifidobacterium goeldii]RSX54293.1 hypothetical protein D2E25_0601 [Bifidobacterium goeldii]